jgi:hypothetical protein
MAHKQVAQDLQILLCLLPHPLLARLHWLRILNSRVFFWASQDGLDRLLGARLNRNRVREVLVVDTLSLAKAYADQMELCPINSGATIRKAARRGLNTFSPLRQYSFNEWSRLRGQRDHIREITIRDAVPDIANHTLEVLSFDPLKFHNSYG